MMKNDISKLVYISKIYTRGLTFGKIYEGGIFNNSHYLIRNDSGFGCYHLKSLFKTLEEVRNEKILTILN